MKDYWIEPVEKKENVINKKKIIILVIIAIFIISITVLGIIYNINRDFRKWIDKNILRKEVKQDTVATIELDDNQNSNIYAFNNYIGILNKNKFEIYGNSRKQRKRTRITYNKSNF